MLHIRNSLLKNRYLENNSPLCCTSDLENLPLREETAVYTQVPKITLSPPFFPLLHQSVAILTRHRSETLVLSPTHKLSSKATELTTANTDTASLAGLTAAKSLI